MPKKKSAKKPAKIKAQPKKKKESGQGEQQKVEDFGRGVGIWIQTGAKQK